MTWSVNSRQWVPIVAMGGARLRSSITADVSTLLYRERNADRRAATIMASRAPTTGSRHNRISAVSSPTCRVSAPALTYAICQIRPGPAAAPAQASEYAAPTTPA